MKTGKLVRWNDEKGYGFIHTETENRDTFIHISVLSHMSRRPVVGDVIFFDEETDSKGKTKANNAKIEGVPRLEPSSESWSLLPSSNNPQAKHRARTQPAKFERPIHRNSRYEKNIKRFSSNLGVLLFIAVALFCFQKFITRKSNYLVEAVPARIEFDPPRTQMVEALLEPKKNDPPRAQMVETVSAQKKIDPPRVQFECQGKTYCSQMTSCAEATFYLNHCPGTKMDGDHDGIPCESQWCN
jgi:cold shock CspA family protein